MRPCSPLRRAATICWTFLILAGLTSAGVFADDHKEVTVQITGKVLTVAGDPASGATVHASLPFGNLDKRVTTKEDGTFDFPIDIKQIALRSVLLRVSSPDGEQLAIERLKTENDEVKTEDLIIQLSETNTAAIRVLDAEDKPVGNAAVAV